MIDTKASLYPHRQNPDGSYASICLKCFLTVATTPCEADLAEHEKKHMCAYAVLVDQASFRPAL